MQNDPWLYRGIVVILGVVVVVALIGVILLAAQSHNVPESLTALGSASIGALTGLLVPSPVVRNAGEKP
jgi:hypothetical protein